MLVKYDIVDSKYDNIISNLNFRILKEEMFKNHKTTEILLPSFIQSVSIEYGNGEIETYEIDNNSTFIILDDIYSDLDDGYVDDNSFLMYEGQHYELYTNFGDIHYNEYVVDKIIEPVYLEKVQLYHLDNIFRIINKFYGNIIIEMTHHQKIFFLHKLKNIYLKNKQKYVGCNSRDILILNLIKDYYCNQMTMN